MANLLEQALDKAGLSRYTAKLKHALAGKQDKITGTKGQVVGFNEKGQPVPQGTESLVGPAGKDGINGKDGTNGKDGISATHQWDGSTLTVTSASGTSSADLRGPAGADGKDGAAGAKGATGATGATGPKGDPGLFYGICSTAASAAEKVVSCSGFILRTGAVVAVKFTFENLASNPTLNVNNEGAKSIYYAEGKVDRAGSWGNGKIVEFLYDGSKWIIINPVFEEGAGIASGAHSHAEGFNARATGLTSHAEGSGSNASGESSHAEGSYCNASGISTHAEGSSTTASGAYAHAEGCNSVASGDMSHAGGYFTISSGQSQTAIGNFNVEYKDSATRFIIGKGMNANARANCFRVTDTGAYATGAHYTSGADYAEMFEWADGNPDHEDRAGRFVTLEGEKIRLATPEDSFILGIVSGSPSVVGDVYDDQWKGMFLTDIFGRPLYEDRDFPAEPGPDGDVLIPAQTRRVQKVNPDYDSQETYIPRTERPEWDAVGMLGKLVAVDDGSCQVNGWCRVGTGGIAAASVERTKYRVMARLDDTHIRVLIL